MKLYVAIDVGCHECCISSEVIGTFRRKAEADEAARRLSKESNDWRDGGLSIPEVFEIEVPE